MTIVGSQLPFGKVIHLMMIERMSYPGRLISPDPNMSHQIIVLPYDLKIFRT
ncbi:MAG: hypothetical protein PVG41_02350 [Desulfobacteraceae bacterium]